MRCDSYRTYMRSDAHQTNLWAITPRRRPGFMLWYCTQEPTLAASASPSQTNRGSSGPVGLSHIGVCPRLAQRLRHNFTYSWKATLAMRCFGVQKVYHVIACRTGTITPKICAYADGVMRPQRRPQYAITYAFRCSARPRSCSGDSGRWAGASASTCACRRLLAAGPWLCSPQWH